ncbi:MAG TPA: hypothetical protein VNE39_13775 [Planctomycetota bacterium]|nr:hypothetical protein [Planctomycetota bacterium]
MRRLLLALLVVAGLVLGFGLYRGWFRADRDRMREDAHTAIEKVREVGDSVVGGAKKEGDTAPEGPQK